MAHLIELSSFNSSSGELTVIEKILPGTIKRVFYIYNTNNIEARGGHRHKKSHHAMVCLKGSCDVLVQNEDSVQTFHIDSPQKLLILEPNDWRLMSNFQNDPILLVVTNQFFSESDYISEPYYPLS